MDGLILNWLIALVVVLLFFAGLYLVVRAAVKSAVKEAATELARDLAKKVWAEDGNTPEQQ
ncbi:MAG: hypothetical protein HFF04_04450 [Oscillospiraceae bacterium]|nr:hypothetical protein [Oscillospiraceae bacterium]